MEDQFDMLCSYSAMAIEKLIANGQASKKTFRQAIKQVFSYPMERLAAFESWKRRIEDSGDEDGWAAAFVYWRECQNLSELRKNAVNRLIEATKDVTELRDQLEAAANRRKLTELENENLRLALYRLGEGDLKLSEKMQNLGHKLIEANEDRENLKKSIDGAKNHWTNRFPHLSWGGDIEEAMKIACETITKLKHEIDVLETRIELHGKLYDKAI